MDTRDPSSEHDLLIEQLLKTDDSSIEAFEQHCREVLDLTVTEETKCEFGAQIEKDEKEKSLAILLELHRRFHSPETGTWPPGEQMLHRLATLHRLSTTGEEHEVIKKVRARLASGLPDIVSTLQLTDHAQTVALRNDLLLLSGLDEYKDTRDSLSQKKPEIDRGIARDLLSKLEGITLTRDTDIWNDPKAKALLEQLWGIQGKLDTGDLSHPDLEKLHELEQQKEATELALTTYPPILIDALRHGLKKKPDATDPDQIIEYDKAFENSGKGKDFVVPFPPSIDTETRLLVYDTVHEMCRRFPMFIRQERDRLVGNVRGTGSDQLLQQIQNSLNGISTVSEGVTFSLFSGAGEWEIVRLHKNDQERTDAEKEAINKGNTRYIVDMQARGTGIIGASGGSAALSLAERTGITILDSRLDNAAPLNRSTVCYVRQSLSDLPLDHEGTCVLLDGWQHFPQKNIKFQFSSRPFEGINNDTTPPQEYEPLTPDQLPFQMIDLLSRTALNSPLTLSDLQKMTRQHLDEVQTGPIQVASKEMTFSLDTTPEEGPTSALEIDLSGYSALIQFEHEIEELFQESVIPLPRRTMEGMRDSRAMLYNFFRNVTEKVITDFPGLRIDEFRGDSMIIREIPYDQNSENIDTRMTAEVQTRIMQTISSVLSREDIMEDMADQVTKFLILWRTITEVQQKKSSALKTLPRKIKRLHQVLNGEIEQPMFTCTKIETASSEFSLSRTQNGTLAFIPT